MTIVGIVADVKHLSLNEESGPEMYVPFTQKPYPSMLTMHFALRAHAGGATLTQDLRDVVHSLDPCVPIAKVSTLDTIVGNSVAARRFSTLLLAAFAAVALLLAACGMYGVISCSVTQRTREIGIRAALGAERRSVLGLVVGHGARLAGVGIVIGLAAAAAVTRLIAGFLYGVRPIDPFTFTFVTLLLIAVALLACYIPARRAARIDPMIALRHE
jgi:putative ABC transport system permease protein